MPDPIQVYNEEYSRGPHWDEVDIYPGPSAPFPPTYAEVTEEPRCYPPRRLAVPDDQFMGLLKENVAWHEAPDPIRQSDFWADGEKIKPDARQWITSRLALRYQESIDEQTFHIGKLIGYLHVPQHAGGQLPSVIRANIQEANPITYGSLYEVAPGPVSSGPAYSASGFDLTGQDGYPY